jgi:hypothetical protein
MTLRLIRFGWKIFLSMKFSPVIDQILIVASALPVIIT